MASERRAAVGPRTGAVLACGLIVLAGCSAEDGAARPEPGASVSGESTPSESAAGEPSATGPVEEPPSSTGPDPSVTTVAPNVESTADRSEAPPADVIRVVRVDVAPPDEDGAERIVIDTAGGTPGYRLRYVDAVRIDGEPVLVDGSAFLELVLESADPQGEQGLAESVAVDLRPDQPVVKHIQMAYYLGDQLTYAIGLDRVVPYVVTTTAEQIVITFSS